MRVVVTDYIEPDLNWEHEQLSPLAVELDSYQLKAAPVERLIEATRDADIVVVNMAPVTSALVSGWRKCSLVIRHGIGYDNVDVQALTKRGIPLVNIPDYCPEEVAEQAIALLYALARKIVFSRTILERSSRQGEWNFEGIAPIHRMKGRTVGIIGCGRIGSRVLRKLSGSGMQLLVCDPYLSTQRQRELGIDVLRLEDVLARADFVTLHTPLNDETRRLISRSTLALMKPSAFLINTARAGLIENEALYEALVNGRLAGAALDVFSPEPPPADFPFFQLPNVILTPHLSWYSVEAEWEIREKIVEQIKRKREGLPLLNCVNPEVLQGQGIDD
ncbi:MAG: C-terminal binding protein [Acidobacteriota bacterium]